MANKVVTGVAGLVVLALVYSGASWYFGKRSEKELEKQLAFFNQKVKASDAKAPEQVFILKNYDRGIFTSHGVVQVGDPFRPNDVVNVDLSVVHGPILWKDFSVGFSTADVAVQETPNLKEASKLFQGHFPTLHSLYGFGGMDQQLTVPLIDAKPMFYVKDAVFNFHINYEHTAFKGGWNIADMQVVDLSDIRPGRGGLSMISTTYAKDHQVNFEGNYTDDQNYHYQFTGSLAQESLDMPMWSALAGKPNTKILTVHDQHAMADLESKKGVANMSFNATAKQVDVFEKPVLPNYAMDAKANNLNGQAFPQMYKALVESFWAEREAKGRDDAGLIKKQIEEKLEMQMKTAASQILRDDSTFEYMPLTVEQDGKKVTSTMKFMFHREPITQALLQGDDGGNLFRQATKHIDWTIDGNPQLLNSVGLNVLAVVGDVSHKPITQAHKDAIAQITQEVGHILLNNQLALKEGDNYHFSLKVDHPQVGQPETYQVNNEAPTDKAGMQAFQARADKADHEIQQLLKKYTPLFSKLF